MTTALIFCTLAVAVVIGWYVFESHWDRRLFAFTPGCVIENVRPEKAKALLESDTGVQVLDVRSAREFEGGSLPGAVNIPLNDPAFRERIESLKTKEPVLVYCAGGYRSRKAVPVLREKGFTCIHHLHRGFHSWQLAGLPIVQTERGSSSRQR